MIKINGKKIEYKTFPDGTLNLKIENPYLDMLTITWIYEKLEEQILLYNIKRHLDVLNSTNPKMTTILEIPYVPNARMDRVKSFDEVFTLKHFCDFINDLKFNRVVVADVHSNVSLALINNVSTFNPYEFETWIENIIIQNSLDKNNVIAFFPDEGATKRYLDHIEMPYAYGIKQRDWKTGEIKSLSIVDNGVDIKGKDVIIFDDICSYGGTFLKSAKLLKDTGANKIILSVTHCENSILKGDLLKSELVDRVHTTNTIFTENHPLIDVVEIW